MNEKIKSSIPTFAYYDTRTDKIQNCEEGSLIWWHEKGHQAAYKLGWLPLLEVVTTYLMLAVILNLITQNYTWATVFFITILIILLGHEVFAWIYGIYFWSQKWKI